MHQQYLTRQFDLIPGAVLDTQITIIGAGAIGSFTALSLAKLGFENILVIDADTVSPENMNSQFFRIKDIGRPKVEALQELIKDFTEVEIAIINGRYEFGQYPGIVIAAVDSMEVRRNIFDQHQYVAANTFAIIDPRMGAETAMLETYDPRLECDLNRYQKTLYSDSEAIQERCTAKSTIYTVNLIAGLVAKTVKDLVTGPRAIRNLAWDIKSMDMQVSDTFGKSMLSLTEVVSMLQTQVKELSGSAANAPKTYRYVTPNAGEWITMTTTTTQTPVG